MDHNGNAKAVVIGAGGFLRIGVPSTSVPSFDAARKASRTEGREVLGETCAAKCLANDNIPGWAMSLKPPNWSRPRRPCPEAL